MEPVPRPDPGLELLRQRRAELRESMNALQLALAAPAPGRAEAWAERVHVALVELSGDLRTHIDVTEGRDGLHHAVLRTAPRLSVAVVRLHRDHVRLRHLVDDLLAGLDGPAAEQRVDMARNRGSDLLTELVRHRRRGADLVFEAYQADLGGEA